MGTERPRLGAAVRGRSGSHLPPPYRVSASRCAVGGHVLECPRCASRRRCREPATLPRLAWLLVASREILHPRPRQERRTLQTAICLCRSPHRPCSSLVRATTAQEGIGASQNGRREAAGVS